MSITNFKVSFAGQQEGVVPRIGRLYAPGSTLTEISAAGFLDNYILSQGFSVLATDIIAAVGSNGTQWYKPVFSASNSCRLTVLP